MDFYYPSELLLAIFSLEPDIFFPSLINSLAGVSFSLIALSDMVVGAKIGLLSSSWLIYFSTKFVSLDDYYSEVVY